MAFASFYIDFLRDEALPDITEDLVEMVSIEFTIIQNQFEYWLTVMDKVHFIAPQCQLSINWPWSLSLLLAKPLWDSIGVTKDQNWPVKIGQQKLKYQAAVCMPVQSYWWRQARKSTEMSMPLKTWNEGQAVFESTVFEAHPSSSESARTLKQGLPLTKSKRGQIYVVEIEVFIFEAWP